MNGMKEGAGDDPFADDEDDDPPSSRDAPVVEAERDTEARSSTPKIPYKFRRDGVQDGRDRVPLFLLEETKSNERTFKADVENTLDEDVQLTDLREAAYRVAMNHVDEVADELREWGYDYDSPQ